MGMMGTLLGALARRLKGPGPPRGSHGMKSRINTVERIGGDKVRKTAGPDFQRNGHAFDAGLLIRREIGFLERLQPSEHFPRVLSSTADSYVMSYGGEPVTRESLPGDWERQAEAILAALDAHGIIHRDIKRQNLLVLDGKLVLIDFSWAYLSREKPEPCPQDFVETIPREMIYDNRKALFRTIQDLQA